MRAATIVLQLTLWAGLAAAVWIATAAHRDAWRLARARRRSERVHLGAGEHPVGSLEGCPGCDTWAASRRAERRLARRRRRWDRNGYRARRWERIAAERWAGGSVSWTASPDRPTDA